MFPGKISNCPDSQNNFGFVPKQRFLELSSPVLFGRLFDAVGNRSALGRIGPSEDLHKL